jgi:hypothetical protein
VFPSFVSGGQMFLAMPDASRQEHDTHDLVKKEASL